MSEKSDLFFDGESEVQQFYRGANVLVTGGTGFVGKVLVEKLLWSCPGVKTIYILIRNKRGKTGQERIEELASSPCFDRLRARCPEFRTKLVAIQGDISVEGLGLSEQDRHLLTEQVTIVFHVAATVRFEEELATAIKQNVRATRDVLALCKMCPRLKAVMHTSSAFANHPLPKIEERFYEPRIDCDEAIKMVEAMGDNDFSPSKTKQLLGNLPNTYVLTKSLAEQVVMKHGTGLPIAISRPAIVICSDKEPAPGWSEYTGPTALIAGIASGVVRTIDGDGDAFANTVPCDMVINSLIVATWEVAEKRLISQEIPIYNFSSPACNRLTWYQFFGKYVDPIREYPSSNALWYPYCWVIKNRLAAMFIRFLLHTLSGNIIDTFLMCQGKKRRLRAAYSKVHSYLRVATRMAGVPWNDEERNIPALWALTSAKDKELFPFDMRTLDWDKFATRSYLGMRKILLKEDEVTIPAARIKMKRYFWIHYTALAVPAVLLCWIAFIIVNIFVQHQELDSN